MKLKKYFTIIIILSLIVLNGGTKTIAMGTNFSTSEMSVEEQETFLSAIQLSRTTDEPQLNSLMCFDVSDSGWIAIGSENHSNKNILVCDENGDFQYGYVFNCTGNFSLQWDDSNLIIYFIRGDVAASFDSNGNCTELKRIEDTTENNSLWNHTVKATSRLVGNYTYQLKSDFPLSFSYSKLIKINNTNQEEIIIYDVGSIYQIRYIIILVAIILFVLISFLVVIKQFHK